MKIFHSLALSALFSLGACWSLPAMAADAGSLNSAQPQKRTFAQWVSIFRQQARSQGIEDWVLEQAFNGLTADHSIIRADQSQPEFTRPVWQYLEGAISPWRIARGKALLAEHASTLAAIERKYAVDRHVLVAIWGMESNFGQQMGDKPIIRSLATLAWDGRRTDFWEEQLMAALQILQNGDVTAGNMLGSWAGAMGQTQFMPGTYLNYAVDFDHNGKRDVWRSPADALASAANYLQHSGWQPGLNWGFEVRLPGSFDYSLADGESRKTLAQWQALGIAPLSAATRLPAASTKASIFLPAGYRGPAYLLLDNFSSILKYNNSSSYALAVGQLADSLAGQLFSLQRWPRDDEPLSRSERLELQQRLNALKLDAGKEDGIMGANTRRAIRQFQLRHDLPADGFPSKNLLLKLRENPTVRRRS